MLSQEFATGHWEAAWKARQHPNIANIYATLWDVEPKDLLTSFDGVSISLPPEVTNKGWFRKNGYTVILLIITRKPSTRSTTVKT